MKIIYSKIKSTTIFHTKFPEVWYKYCIPGNFHQGNLLPISLQRQNLTGIIFIAWKISGRQNTCLSHCHKNLAGEMFHLCTQKCVAYFFLMIISRYINEIQCWPNVLTRMVVIKSIPTVTCQGDFTWDTNSLCKS